MSEDQDSMLHDATQLYNNNMRRWNKKKNMTSKMC